MRQPVKILICINPIAYQKDDCKNCNSTEFIHHLKVDDLNLTTSSPPNEKENGIFQSDIEGRRISGKNLFRIKQLGIEDMVNDMLNNKHLTLKDIAEAVYKSTGQRISTATLSRHYKRCKSKKV